ncbi:MAG: VWA domain-containing protein [Coriobacteriales bacterium]|nr:VWA domain-containing protein [Coriobacteriales bacterium]
MKKTVAFSLSLLLSFTLMLSGCSAGGGLEGGYGDAPSLELGEGYADNGGNYAPMPDGDFGDATLGDGYNSYPYDYSYEGEQYLNIIEQGRRFTVSDPEITLSLKVDTAAYSNMRRYIENGQLPPADAVRTEELINYFEYDEPIAPVGESPFAVYTELGTSPFDSSKKLAFIRIKTEDIDKNELPPSNLVFLIDTSGSMESYDKLPLLQNAFSLLTDTLDEDDRISIVTYAGSSKVVLSGVRGSEKNRINSAIFELSAGGSTAGAEGIQTAYSLAQEYFIRGGNNRVILATDGDFNVGLSDTASLADFIGEKRDTGIYLSVLGFGTGNIRDDIMETLSKEGNGNYSYLDSQQTAKKVLINELGSNLFTVANDVKALVAFNPEAVESYRLIGYENRTMNNEDFADDRKDAGEMGAGSDIVILFELDMTDESATPFTVNIRYKDPGASASQLITVAAKPLSAWGSNTTDFGFASSVALFGDLLRHPNDASFRQLDTVITLAESNLGRDREAYREEYLRLLYTASELIG